MDDSLPNDIEKGNVTEKGQSSQDVNKNSQNLNSNDNQTLKK